MVSVNESHLYGEQFKQGIIDFLLKKEAAGEKIQGSTHILSYALYKDGKTIEEISVQRELKDTTISGHLARAYEQGEDLDISTFVSEEEIDMVLGMLHLMNTPYKMLDIFNYFEEKMSYEKIRFALAHYYLEETQV